MFHCQVLPRKTVMYYLNLSVRPILVTVIPLVQRSGTLCTRDCVGLTGTSMVLLMVLYDMMDNSVLTLALRDHPSLAMMPTYVSRTLRI